jgi:DNA mismatch repair protein MutS2
MFILYHSVFLIEMEFYNKDTLSTFGFDKIREAVAGYATHHKAKELAGKMTPVKDFAKLNRYLLQTNELLSIVKNGLSFPQIDIPDFSEAAMLLKIEGSILSIEQLIQIKDATEVANNIAKYFSDKTDLFPELSALAAPIHINTFVIDSINAIIDEQGQVKSNASPELARIRKELIYLRKQSDKLFLQLKQRLANEGMLRENEENFYNGRRVLAVLAEYKKSIKGFLHGKSDSAQTIYIEPNETIEINNDIAEAEAGELIEINRLLKQVSQQIRPHASEIKQYDSIICTLDFIRAKALFAHAIKACLPRLVKQPEILLKEAYHPLLYLQNAAAQKSIVPLQIQLNKNQRIIVISGPNAGGKSIALKTVGLFQLMLQSGLLVSCKEDSVMSFFHQIMEDIGDTQSIENELSTYSSRLKRMKKYLAIANEKSLLLIDEFGSGTEPEMGSAIAESMLESFAKDKTFGIITTHYTGLKILADQLPNVSNANMLFNIETLQPTYQLIIGQPGSSYALEVAQIIGLPKSIIENSRQKVDQNQVKFNKLIAKLQKDQVQLKDQLEQANKEKLALQKAKEKHSSASEALEQQYTENESRLDDLYKQARLGERFQKIIDEWIEKPKERKATIKRIIDTLTAEKKKFEKNNTDDKIAAREKAYVESLMPKIKIGSVVKVKNGHKEGKIEELTKKHAKVNFGNLVATVSLEKLQLVERKQTS